MYPRWRSEDSAPHPSTPKKGDSGLGLSRQDLFAEPLPDLEQQLSAELRGASWAVVDFAPEDGDWCDWIYACLNGYPLPPALVDRVTPNGIPRPDCLSIFPDRRDPSYEEHAAEALKDSAYLIVLCSPKSAGSVNVVETIRTFRNAGGEERIIALVVDGAPDSSHDQAPRSTDIEWLPSWLRWRCDEKGFCPADRTEFRIVDGRRGYSNLKRMRDELLTAIVEIDAAELESLGAFNRALPEVRQVATVAKSPMPQTYSTAFPAPVREPGTKRDAAFMIGTALVLMVVAVIFGIKSFQEMSAEEPQSALASAPTVPSRLERLAQSLPSLVTESEPVAPIANPEAVLESSTPVAVVSEPAAPAPASVAPAPAPASAAIAQTSTTTEPVSVAKAEPAARPNLPQVSATQWAALTRVQPTAPASPTTSAAPASAPAGVAPTSTVDDAVLLDEVKTLERRGDEIMAERRTEDALDLYRTALGSAVEYANRKGANPTAKYQVVTLYRKLGLLQLQNASTAEARSTYQQARKTLLQLKAQGVWDRGSAKMLDELESRLLSLPKD